MTEADPELESLLAQCANRPLHHLGNLANRRSCLGVFAQLSVMSLRPCYALSPLGCFSQLITPGFEDARVVSYAIASATTQFHPMNKPGADSSLRQEAN
jgi:hypothetical protein